MDASGLPGLLTDSLSADTLAASAAPAKHPRAGPHLYLNRELGQLAFTRRVLAQAENRDYPLLERLKFLCIVSSNLDEFFEIRVAGLHAEIEAATPPVGPDRMRPSVVFDEVAAEAHALVAAQYQLLDAGGGDRVERRRGLVQQQHLGLYRNAAGNAQALLLPP